MSRQPSGTGRRTPAEPLAAAWRPGPRGDGRARSDRRKRGLHRLANTYGWRLYALPILVVVTVLVLVDTLGDSGGDVTAAGQQTDSVRGSTQPPATPDATEQPAGPVDVNVPSALLPNGGVFTQAGTGTWHVVPGAGEKVGTGAKLYTYSVEVEDGLEPTAFGGDDAFAKLIDETLADPRGWTSDGKVAVQRVDPGQNPTFRISLTSPDTVHGGDVCGYSIKAESSCYRRGEPNRVVINLARWVRGATAFGGDMLTYRQYAINHEVGHAFNNGHRGCEAEGALAPVMMQQSFGVANNYVAELNRQVGNRDPINADGKTCKPNPWPNPQAKPAG